MMNYRLMIAYDGTAYQGWQRQANTDKTIQGLIETKLSGLFHEPIHVHGSGRTDAGVHASGQTANFQMSQEIGSGELRTLLNRQLPADIRIIKCQHAGIHFHSRYHALSKVYCYTIDRRKTSSVFQRKYSWHIPKPLQVEAMTTAAVQLEGKHDFRSFTAMKDLEKSAWRTIYKIDIQENGSLLHLYYHGDGFLYQMVRIITGTLAEVGRGNIPPSCIGDILEAKRRIAAGPSAPAEGLCLSRVYYD